jgi:long-chain-fatty-acid---luciferin-component ligase
MLDFKALKAIAELEDLIYQNEECFLFDESQIEELQEKFIISTFKFHYDNCKQYRNYCEKQGVGPCAIQSFKDIEKIPLIPSTLFKDLKILSCEEDNIVKKCTSSGTKGSISIVYRDEDTMNRFLGSIQLTMDQILNIDDAFCINLGPSTEEAGDLWFSYTISNLDLLFPTENFVINDIFYPEKVIDSISTTFKSYENLIVIGAPIMFLELLGYMQKNNIVIEDSQNIFFITAGGWKRFSGKAISREVFKAAICNNFKNTKDSNFRDMLNMVELNNVVPECEHNIKHIVPWVNVRIIDPSNMKNVPDGQEGLIAYLDPTTSSYPCFILTDDIGKIVQRGKCACGKIGVGIEYLRRVNSPESRGCALKIDAKYAK